jgi:hypothetical protein
VTLPGFVVNPGRAALRPRKAPWLPGWLLWRVKAPPGVRAALRATNSRVYIHGLELYASSKEYTDRAACHRAVNLRPPDLGVSRGARHRARHAPWSVSPA